MKYLYLLLAALLFVSSSFAASPTRVILEDDFVEASDTFLEDHTPDSVLFGGTYYDSYHFNKVGGAEDAVIRGPSSLSYYYSNYIYLGDFTYPVRYDFTYQTNTLYHVSTFTFRRENVAPNPTNYMYLQFFMTGGTTMTVTLGYKDSGGTHTLVSTSVPFSAANIYNFIIDDTGTNVKVYVDACSGEDGLGEASTLWIDSDTSDYNTQKYMGYNIYSFNYLTITSWLYHIKVYDSGVSETPTPTVTPTVTVTPTATPDPSRKSFTYDDARRNMKYDDLRHDMLYDDERRILKKR